MYVIFEDSLCAERVCHAKRIISLGSEAAAKQELKRISRQKDNVKRFRVMTRDMDEAFGPSRDTSIIDCLMMYNGFRAAESKDYRKYYIKYFNTSC